MVGFLDLAITLCVSLCRLTLTSVNAFDFTPAVVIIAHKDVHRLRGTLQALLELVDIDLFKVYVSLDYPRAFQDLEMVVSEVEQDFHRSIEMFYSSPGNNASKLPAQPSPLT